MAIKKPLKQSIRQNIKSRIQQGSVLPIIDSSLVIHSASQYPGFTKSQLLDLTGSAVDGWVGINNTTGSTQTTESKRPIYTQEAINNQPALLFTNANAVFLEGTNLSLIDFTQFIVVERNSTGSANYMLCSLTGRSIDSLFGVNDKKVRFITGGATPLESISTFDAGEPFIVAITYNDSTSDVEMFINGASEDTGTEESVGMRTNAYQIGAVLGMNNFDGFIGEVIVYDRILSNAEISRVFEYLGSKFRIGLV